MNVVEFLTRVCGPGNYLAIAWKHPTKGGMHHRFYPRGEVGHAASMTKWLVGKGNDVWYAPFSFEHADSRTDNRGQLVWEGKRTQDNATASRVFVVDLDVSRPGDGKTNVYATPLEAVTALKAFLTATGLPTPNLRVNSGYGFHFYWVLEDAMPRAQWQPYADALKAALVQHGIKCDTSVTVDAARIVRAPDTLNFKAGMPGVPVTAHPAQMGDYPNQIVLDKLTPYLGIVTTTVGLAPAATSPLAGGGGPALPAAGSTPNMNAAAQAGIQQAAPRSFAHIATKCAQVQQSLANHGARDGRELWYKGFITLAAFCADGATAAHDVSKGHVHYKPHEVDTELARAQREQVAKGFGPPRCTSFNAMRPGVCQTCPHFNKIASPWTIGVVGNNGDLPFGYVRQNGNIEVGTKDKDGNLQFLKVITGDVYLPIVHKNGEEYVIDFTYECAGRRFSVRVLNSQLAGDTTLGIYLARSGITLMPEQTPRMGRFLLSWINTIRAQNGERTDHIPPFGYATDAANKHIGIAVAGTLYRSDGSEDYAPGGDKSINDQCTPRGTYAKWREAFDLVTKDCVERQIIVAVAFGSVLMTMTGQRGLLFSAYGRSGIAKSAAMAVCQSVYGVPKMMSTLKDTNNAVMHKAEKLSILPLLWDEARIDKDNANTLMDFMFGISMGQGKARMDQNIQVRPVGTWDLLSMVCSNTQLMDFVVNRVKGSSAGSNRMFEFFMDLPEMPSDAGAALTIAQTQTNYGHAGRMFVKYVAQHYDTIRLRVEDLMKKLNTTFAATNEERLFIAGIAATMIATDITTQENIAPFDRKKMFAFFHKYFLELRDDRTQNLVTSGSTMDVESILSEYYSDKLPYRVGTDFVASKPGFPAPPRPVTVEINPAHAKAEIQIARCDRIMRISLRSFNDWCYAHEYRALTVVRLLEAKYGAKKIGKLTIGSGTPYAGGQFPVLEFDLSHPELVNSFLTTHQAAVAASLATTPKPVFKPGNKPVV